MVRRKSSRLKGYEAEFRIARSAVMLRAEGRCEWREMIDGDVVRCESRAHHVHHLVARSHAGSNQESNLVALCSDHHRFAHEHVALAVGAGYIVRGVS
jgi:5-methylcytosine-specific restriction endonuclease McrA